MASSTQKVALSTISQIIGRVVQLSLGLISIKILTNYLGVSGYGEYSIIFAYCSLAAVFADFGTTSIIIRELSQKKSPLGHLIGSGFVVNATFGVLTAIAFSILLIFFPYESHVKLGVLMALLGTAIVNINIYGSYFSYKIRQDVIVIIETSGRLVNVLLLVWLVQIHAPFLWIIAATPIGFVYNFLLGTTLVLREKIRPRVDWKLARYIFWHGVPIGIVAVLSVAQYRLDSVILSVLRTPHDVAIYSVASKIVDLLVIIPAFFMSAVFPLLSSAYHSGIEFQKKSRMAFDFLLMVALPALVGAFMLAPQLISLIGSREFIAAALPLQILTGSILLGVLTLYYSNLAIIAGLQKKMVPRSAIAVVINVIANIILIPILSYTGAATAAVISSFVGLILIAKLVRKQVRVKQSINRMLKIILSVTIMGTSLYFLRDFDLWVSGSLSGIIYLLALILTRALSFADLQSLIPESITNKFRK